VAAKRLSAIGGESTEGRPRVGGDTPAFCIDVNSKELLAEGFVSA
jgi:hypothetical protein